MDASGVAGDTTQHRPTADSGRQFGRDRQANVLPEHSGQWPGCYTVQNHTTRDRTRLSSLPDNDFTVRPEETDDSKPRLHRRQGPLWQKPQSHAGVHFLVPRQPGVNIRHG